MLPLALGMVGTLAKDQPLDPASWYSLHEKLREASDSFEQTDDGALFSSILTSFDFLPPAQQDQLRLMAVMPSGVVATSEMLANLWDQVSMRYHIRHAARVSISEVQQACRRRCRWLCCIFQYFSWGDFNYCACTKQASTRHHVRGPTVDMGSTSRNILSRGR